MIRQLCKAEKLLDKEDMFMKYEVEVKDIKGIYAACNRGIIQRTAFIFIVTRIKLVTFYV